MADIFFDCEWVGGDYLTILGAYSYGQGRFQLYGSKLTKKRFDQFVNTCRTTYRETFLFCHGPDIGRIENYFDFNLKRSFFCINTQTAFRRLAGFKTVGLDHLERVLGLARKYSLAVEQMYDMWNWGSKEDRKIVLDYNWEDCVNLWRLVRILMRKYGVTRRDLERIAM